MNTAEYKAIEHFIRLYGYGMLSPELREEYEREADRELENMRAATGRKREKFDHQPDHARLWYDTSRE